MAGTYLSLLYFYSQHYFTLKSEKHLTENLFINEFGKYKRISCKAHWKCFSNDGINYITGTNSSKQLISTILSNQEY